MTVDESRVDGPMREEYPRARDVTGGTGEQEEDRRAREQEGAVFQVEPRPGRIDFDRVAVQIVRDRHEELAGEEPLGKRAARWKVTRVTLRSCLLDADWERADPRHTFIRACCRGQRDRRRGEPKDKAEKSRKPLHNSLLSFSRPPTQRLSFGLLDLASKGPAGVKRGITRLFQLDKVRHTSSISLCGSGRSSDAHDRAGDSDREPGPRVGRISGSRPAPSG